MNLKDKVCIITGAASGIGHGIAERFIADGAKVVIADLKLDAAQKTADALTAQGPGTAMAVEMDVTDEAQVNAGIEAVVTKWGKIDVLVSNAGIQIVHPLQDFPFADWKKLPKHHDLLKIMVVRLPKVPKPVVLISHLLSLLSLGSSTHVLWGELLIRVKLRF